MLCAEADAVVGTRYRHDFGRADRLGEFERRLVGAAAQAAPGERLGHALVKFDDGRVRPSALPAAQENAYLFAAQPHEARGGEKEYAGQNRERRRQNGEDARAAAPAPPGGQARTQRIGRLRRGAAVRADALRGASRERLLSAPIISDDVLEPKQ